MRSWLSLRTCKARCTSEVLPLSLPIGNRSMTSTSHSRPASSWQSTPGGTATYFAHACGVRHGGTEADFLSSRGNVDQHAVADRIGGV